MNAYLLVFHSQEGKVGRQEILDFLDTIPEIVNWRAMAGSIIFVSNLPVREISEKVHTQFPKLMYLITPLAIDDVWGWVDEKSWDMIRNPRVP